jgi:ketosteroid isomerase-like protein
VAPAFELGPEKGLDDWPRLVGRQAPTRKSENIGIVMAAAHLGLFGIVRVHRAHAVDLVGDDRNADSRTTNQHRQLGIAIGNHASGVGGMSGVVGGLLRVRADVHDLVPALFEQRPDELLELESGVVRSDGDLHECDDSDGRGADTLGPMASSDIDLLKQGFDRLTSDGYEALVPLVHPDFEMQTPAALAAEPQRYEGVDGFRRWWTSFLEVMDTVTLEAKAFHEIGPDKYAIETVMRAVGGASGIETTQEVVMVTTLRDGKMIHIAFATTLENAREGRLA